MTNEKCCGKITSRLEKRSRNTSHTAVARWAGFEEVYQLYVCGWVAQNWLVCESCNPRKQNAEYHPETMWKALHIRECIRPKFYKPNYSSW